MTPLPMDAVLRLPIEFQYRKGLFIDTIGVPRGTVVRVLGPVPDPVHTIYLAEVIRAGRPYQARVSKNHLVEVAAWCPVVLAS